MSDLTARDRHCSAWTAKALRLTFDSMMPTDISSLSVIADK